MTANGWIQIGVYFLVILAITKPMGVWLYRTYEGEARPLARLLGPLEEFCFRLCGVDPKEEQTWTGYTFAALAFSAFGMLVTYAILRLQWYLPLNKQGFLGIEPSLAFNTAASFVTNTNWQFYTGESSMSYLSQMAGLAWHNFTSAATGMAVAIALVRGLTRRLAPGAPRTIGNFWADIIRSIVYILLPASIVVAVWFVSQGMLQNLSVYREVTTLEGIKQLLPMGPVASQEVIKMFGTNGGGFFNANSAHPWENPTALTNFVQMVLIFAIPAGLTWTYGKMARDTKQGWAIWAAMAILSITGVAVVYQQESKPVTAISGLAVETSAGNLEGKEVRFGIPASATFVTVTTDASCGAVDAVHDSLTPLGGLVPMANIALGELVFGGVGSGLYAMLVFVVLSVFIAGLMVGRTPELLGKKIEGREMKLAMLYILIFPLSILVFAAWSAVVPYGTAALTNAGPHGLSEILYAYISTNGNNGSAFAGLSPTQPSMWWNISTGVATLVGRFLMMVPILGIAGAMVGKKTVPPGPGTFPTDGPLFTVLLVGVIIIVGALTFFPAFVLGPIVEHFVGLQGKVF